MADRSIAIAGSSGLIGTAVSEALTARGDAVVRLVRYDSPSGTGKSIRWDPEGPERPDLTGFDAVIDFCGAPIAGQRWTGAVKQELRDSRLAPTLALADAVAAARVPVFLNASAVGFYGDAGEGVCIDSGVDATPNGDGFLAELCLDWEEATAAASDAGTRVAKLRFGHVLSASGGLLPPMRRLHRFALGGRIGSGHQYLPWIAIDDAARAVLHVLDGNLSGPINVTGPDPVRQAAFSDALARFVGRPAPWVVPRTVVRLAAGEIADEGLLASQRAVPKALRDDGFHFAYPRLDAALAAAFDAPYGRA
ncbi:TIGR01777 family oxidoreductase [Tsukamurella sp. 8F]|uniref:TIGR01777 family oxidoreductase n=1 Tax=unclassified Tsukamurella TaxID=2633480 RepID=UPI0023BA14AF|nr:MULTISPECIES: TIGR01777 family oxidoreductase [unclassified Tsukamurella]MDF0529925.1 TIGR01777 family oxidoreductase [Tsukamurella sp. 8J]MDF0587303.1 TIGR01777 family oxidoreductase [Tsukamurella sp. 8F]